METEGGASDSTGGSAAPTVVRTTYDWATTAPSIAIVETVAAIEGTDPVALSTDEGLTLGDYVDPEALDTLVADERGAVRELTVSVDGYTVRIDGNEVVVVVGARDRSREP